MHDCAVDDVLLLELHSDGTAPPAPRKIRCGGFFFT
jgi:hypothetical protein